MRFQGTETWTRTDTGSGDHRYVAKKTGTVTILDDALVEGDETFEIVLERAPGQTAFTIDGEAEATITIEDADTFGVAVTASPDVVMGETSTDVTVTLAILDGEGVAPGRSASASSPTPSRA